MEFCSLVILTLLWNLLDVKKCSSLDSDINQNVSEIISSKGYPVEEYTVVTVDGYILSLQRIPHGRKQKKTGNCKRDVVLLLHGFSCDSAVFLTDSPEQSLGFVLADNDHDVWLGNQRGNKYSRRHVKFTPDMKEFWNFSFDEYAAYDLTAMIDFVLNQTKEEQLVCIAHSQGTAVVFALLSQSPKYNQKIKLFIAMAPVTAPNHMTSWIQLAVPFANEIYFAFELTRNYEFALPSIIQNYLRSGACNGLLKPLCEIILFGFFGYDPIQLNETRLSFYSTLILSGTSIRNALHFAQVIKTGKFRKFDYGIPGNLRYYNQVTPPFYDISKITTPVALIWGMNDKIAVPIDVLELAKRLPSLSLNYRVPYEAFCHVDFLFAIDVYKLLNQKILELLCKPSR